MKTPKTDFRIVHASTIICDCVQILTGEIPDEFIVNLSSWINLLLLDDKESKDMGHF